MISTDSRCEAAAYIPFFVGAYHGIYAPDKGAIDGICRLLDIILYRQKLIRR